MSTNKTMPTPIAPADFLAAVDHPRRRADGQMLDQIFREETGFEPVMWGPTIVGYGRYHYTYDSGRQGDSLATGFSPRKTNLSVYVMPGYADFEHILARLGKHKMGKSCLYINKLDDIDVDVLRELIRAGLADLANRWDIHPT